MAEQHEGQGVKVDVTIFWIPLGSVLISLSVDRAKTKTTLNIRKQRFTAEQFKAQNHQACHTPSLAERIDAGSPKPVPYFAWCG